VDLMKTATGVVTMPAKLALRVASGLLNRGGDEPPPPPPPAPAPSAGVRQAQEARAAAARPSRRRPRRAPKDIGDPAIARKVESALFADHEVDKGKIDVNVADGVVWLRGEAPRPDVINELERRASEVPEVKQVENLLHLPKTPAPTRTDTPATQRKTRRSPRKPAARKVTPKDVTAESPRGRTAPGNADKAK
jgi:hypothetical protein